MAFQSGTTSGTLDYRDLMTKMVDFATSKHISAAVINAAGTLYTAGDLLTITHASAHLNAVIEVLTVGGGGDILTFKIRSAGAFAALVASATVSAGGSGYTNGSILQVEGGTWTNRAKFTATVAAGAVTSVALFEGGGAYSAFPSNPAATTVVGPSGVAGTGCTLNLTTQAIIGTTGIAVTGGTGSGATFDLTLTDTGQTAVRNLNNFSINSVTNEKEVILEGTVSGGNVPYCGFRSYTQTSGPSTRYGWVVFGMDSFNDGLTTDVQPNVGPLMTVGSTGINLLTFNAAESFWMNITGRRIILIRKAQGVSLLTYQSMYAGLLNPMATETEYPYPMYLSASTSVSNRLPDAGGVLVTGLTELHSESTTTCPAFFRHPGTGVWTRVQNISNGSQQQTNTLYPLGAARYADGGATNEDNISDDSVHDIYDELNDTAGSTPGILMYPTIGDNEGFMIPCLVISTPTASDNDSDTIVRGELDHVFWVSSKKSDGSDMAPEDTLTNDAGERYRVFTNAGRSQAYQFFAIKEG